MGQGKPDRARDRIHRDQGTGVLLRHPRRGVSARCTTTKEFDMAPRAYWKGYLRLSVVTCPIELFPATSQSEKTHFHLINTEAGHRLRPQMVDETTAQGVAQTTKSLSH